MNPHSSTVIAANERPKTGVPQVFAEDVQEFLAEHELDLPLRKALDVAIAQFDLKSPPTVRLVEDAESGEQWVEINVRASGELGAVRAAHRRYTEMWLGLVPPEHALKIRLSIHIA